MTLNPAEVPWPDPEFEENNRRFPAEELARHAGLHVAWSWDGTRILASGTNRDEVERKLVEAGIDPSRVGGDFIPPPGLSLFP